MLNYQKRSWRSASLLLIAGLLLLSACAGSAGQPDSPSASNPEQTDEGSADQAGSGAAEHATLQILYADTGRTKMTSELHVLKETGDAVNVTIEPIPVPLATLAEKVNSSIAGGDLPDIVSLPPGPFSLDMQYKSDLFVALDEHLDKMPNLKKMIETYPEIRRVSYADDGHLYHFPVIQLDSPVINQMTGRTDLLEKHGIDPMELNTLDAYYEALEVLKEELQAPPIVVRGGFENLKLVMPLMFGTSFNVWFNYHNQDWSYGPLEENFKTMVEFLARGYQDGLLHPDFMTLDGEVGYNLIVDGRAGFFPMHPPVSIRNVNVDAAQIGGNSPEYEWGLMGLPAVNGRQSKVFRVPVVDNASFRKAISKNTPHLDAALRYMDFLYSDEGIQLAYLGREGVAWHTNANGEFEWIYTLTGKDAEGNPAPRVTELGVNENSFNMAVFANVIVPFRAETPEFDKAIAARLQAYDDRGWLLDPPPRPVFTSEENQQLARLVTPLQTFVDEQTAQFITGRKSLDEWDGFIEQVRSMKVDEIMDLYATAMQRQE